MLKGPLLLIALMLLGTGSASALEDFQYYRGLRGLGMGGATLAVVNDETAVAVNPAGLGKLRNFFGTLVDPEIETNSVSQGLLLKANLGPFTDVDELAGILEANPEKYFYSRMQVFPSLVVRNFGLGLLYTQENYGIYDEDDGTMDLLSRKDMSYLVGYSFRFWDGRIKLGFTGKYIQRSIVAETDLDYAATPEPSILLKEGTALGVDAGLLLTAPWKLLPTLGVVVKDVGDTKFNGDSEELPDPQEQSVDVGLSLSPIHGRGLRSQWSLEYRNVLDTGGEISAIDRLHFGTEFNYSDLFFVRAGMHQRYWTLGSEFATEFFQIQFATYATNIGTSEDPSEDRRYAIKFGVRF